MLKGDFSLCVFICKPEDFTPINLNCFSFPRTFDSSCLINILLFSNTACYYFVTFIGGNLKHFLQSLKVNESSGSTTGFFGSNLFKLDQVSTQEFVEMAIQVSNFGNRRRLKY